MRQIIFIVTIFLAACDVDAYTVYEKDDIKISYPEEWKLSLDTTFSDLADREISVEIGDVSSFSIYIINDDGERFYNDINLEKYIDLLFPKVFPNENEYMVANKNRSTLYYGEMKGRKISIKSNVGFETEVLAFDRSADNKKVFVIFFMDSAEFHGLEGDIKKVLSDIEISI